MLQWSERRDRTRAVLLVVMIVTACAVVALALPPRAQAVIPVSTCERGRDGGDGTTRQSFDAVEVSGAIAAIPPRSVVDVDPGAARPVCIGFQNRTGRAIDMGVSTFNVGFDEDGAPLTTEQSALYGAGEWLALPTKRIRGLEHGDIAWLRAVTDVPADAASGSWYASVRATFTVVDERPEGQRGGVDIAQRRSVVSQVFIDVPGDRVTGGRVVGERAPRVIWWDGFGMGDVPFLERLRGLGVATFRFGWQNTGSVTDAVGGSVEIASDLGGRRVASIPLAETTVLRGATREIEATWSKDVPFVGRFTPTVRIKDSAGQVHEHELAPVWVFPAWWYVLALVVAIAVPVWRRRRAKRRYGELLDRVEAAEAREASEDGYGSDLDADSADERW